MGNALPLPCTCKEASAVVQPTAGGAKKTRRIKRPAVDRAGGEEYAVQQLKVVLTRKDAAVFVARLEERARRAAEERKTRMRMRGLALGSGAGVASPCRDTWSPRLATIAEK